MVPCPDCDGVAPLCDACLDARDAQLRGTARARGYAWGEKIARQLGPTAPPWPPFSGRAKAIALAKVAELAADRRLIDRLAAHCWADAERRYEKLRGGEREAG